MSCQKRAGDPMVKGQDGMGAEVFVMPGTHRRQIGNIVNCSQK